jgi:hypothetical protein
MGPALACWLAAETDDTVSSCMGMNATGVDNR